MGAVDFRYVVPPGHIPVTAFADTFNRPDEPPFLGSQWSMQIATTTAMTGSDLDANINVGGVGVATFGSLVSGGIANANFVPAYVDRLAIKNATASGRKMFSQFRFRSVNGGISVAMGPMVYNPNPNDPNCYILICQLAGRAMQLFRGNGPGAAIVNGAVGIHADNDVLRVEVTGGPLSNVIQCFQNGTLISTDTDASGARPQGGGIFGLAYFSSNAAGGSESFDNYSGGII